VEHILPFLQKGQTKIYDLNWALWIFLSLDILLHARQIAQVVPGKMNILIRPGALVLLRSQHPQKSTMDLGKPTQSKYFSKSTPIYQIKMSQQTAKEKI
jgi:hypothetical protein